MSSYEDFVEFVEYAKRCKERPRRYLRDHSNPFEKYSDEEFFKRYRFTPQAIKNAILPILASHLKRPSKRGLPFAPELMLLVTLRFYATGCFQKLDGDFMNICQQSASRIIATVSHAIALQMKRFIKYPCAVEDINQIKQKFYEIAQFPGVIGCIDCTHIKIKKPSGASAEKFKNVKGFYSINVQAVTGPSLDFLDLVVRWPGSTRDDYIFDNSSIKQRLSTGNLQGQGLLLGDSSYTISSVLLTPFWSPNSIAQEMYNQSHLKTRIGVQKIFGLWKRRFPCLQVGMGIKKETVVAVICACATLYNMSIKLDDVMRLANTESDNIPIENMVDAPAPEDPNSHGFWARQSLVNRFFSQ